MYFIRNLTEKSYIKIFILYLKPLTIVVQDSYEAIIKAEILPKFTKKQFPIYLNQ